MAVDQASSLNDLHEPEPLKMNAETKMEKIKIEQHSFSGMLWAAGWLFTVGFLHLAFWRGVLAIILWPYYLGVMLSAHLH